MEKKSCFLIIIGLLAWNIGLSQSNTFPGSGNVGIGTTSPRSELEIYKNNDALDYLLTITKRHQGSINNKAGIKFLLNIIDTNRFASITVGSHNTWGRQTYFDFNTSSGSDNYPVSRMRIDHNGNIGINTTNPEKTLDVNGSIALGINKEIIFRRSDGHWSGHIGNIDKELRFRNTSGSGYLTFYQNPNGTGTVEIMRIHSNGYLGIGTTNPTELLTVNGTAKAEEVIVVENVGADFVFEENYALPELGEVEAHIKQHKRLPEIPSAEEMIEDGVKVGDLQMKLLQKVEELTLYILDQEKRIRELETIIQTNEESK